MRHGRRWAGLVAWLVAWSAAAPAWAQQRPFSWLPQSQAQVPAPDQTNGQVPGLQQGVDQLRTRNSFGQGQGGMLNGFAAEALIPSEDYVLGPGDLLTIHFWGGEANLDFPVTVNPQGKIYLSRLGEVRAAGQTPQQLEATLRKQLQARTADTQLLVLLTQPRLIKVFVTGQVFSPGVYTIPAETRVSEVLRIAGGITDNGSIRRIQLTGADRAERQLDLSRFAFGGDIESNPKVQAGDQLRIPLITRRIGLAGQVTRPGIYELADGDSLAQLLALAGGATGQAGLSEAVYWPGGLQGQPASLQRLNLAASDTVLPEPKDGDILFVPAQRNPQDTNVVFVYGQVGRPGAVPYRAGAKLSDYLNAAGGPTPYSHLPGVRITRAARGEQAKVVEANAHDILYNGRFDLDPEVGPNDVIYVPESFFNFRNFSELSGLVLSGVGLVGVITGLFR